MEKAVIKVLLSGCNGKMGRSICDLLKNSKNFQVVGYDISSDCSGEIPVYNDLSDIAECPDIIIDFSSPDCTHTVLNYAYLNEIPIVIGTTGLSEQLIASIKTYFCNKIPVFLENNMSRGINILLLLAHYLIRNFSNDITILEKHHKHMESTPSEIASMIANLSTIRLGDIWGEHTFDFHSKGERIIITHIAESQEAFARGAIEAACFLLKQDNGFYNMCDLISEKYQL